MVPGSTKLLIDQNVTADILRRVTSDVISTMLDLPVNAGEHYTETQPPERSEGIVSFVGLAGGECAGTGSLHCGSDAACRFASQFLMSELSAVDDEVLDAFGELTNMIIGNFKNEIELHTGPMGLSIPTVIHGRNFSTRSLGRDEWTVVPFQCGDDRLNVKVCLKTRQTQAPAPHHGDRHELVLGL
jgi:chemotaxis protein CheX